MKQLPITREQAMELLKKYNRVVDKSDWNHYLESESVMGEVAKKLERKWDLNKIEIRPIKTNWLCKNQKC